MIYNSDYQDVLQDEPATSSIREFSDVQFSTLNQTCLRKERFRKAFQNFQKHNTKSTVVTYPSLQQISLQLDFLKWTCLESVFHWAHGTTHTPISQRKHTMSDSSNFSVRLFIKYYPENFHKFIAENNMCDNWWKSKNHAWYRIIQINSNEKILNKNTLSLKSSKNKFWKKYDYIYVENIIIIAESTHKRMLYWFFTKWKYPRSYSNT